jgi:hypothetical protein
MSRKLLPALCAMLVAASAALISTPARAHYHAHNRACVVTEHRTWLWPYWCHSYHCRLRVDWGLAFRIRGQNRRWLLVRNVGMEGWIDLGAVRPAHSDYCRAAGI